MCRLEFRLYIITNNIIWELYFNDMLAMKIHVCRKTNMLIKLFALYLQNNFS